MAIAKGYGVNLETLIRAAKNGDLALVECTDKVTGHPVITVCAIAFDGNQYAIVPLAKMFNGDPYKELNLPE